MLAPNSPVGTLSSMGWMTHFVSLPPSPLHPQYHAPLALGSLDQMAHSSDSQACHHELVLGTILTQSACILVATQRGPRAPTDRRLPFYGLCAAFHTCHSNQPCCLVCSTAHGTLCPLCLVLCPIVPG